MKETLQAVIVLREAFTEYMSDASVTVYTAALKDIEPQLLKAAVDNLVRTHKKRPSIAEIREEAQRIGDAVTGAERMLDADEAWALLDHAASRRGYDDGLQSVPEAVRKVAVPYWHDICRGNINEKGIVRAQFRNAYNAYMDREKTRERIQTAIESNAMLSAAQKANALKLQDSIKQLATTKAVE